MRNLRYILRLIIAFIQRFKVIIFIAFLLGIGFFFLLRSFALLNLTNAQIIGITGRYTVNSLPAEIENKISRGLTKISDNGEVSPDLAVSWETPDKGKTWIFSLDKDIKWQDGKDLKSSDISYNFSDVAVNYPNDSTIEFKLQNSYSAFPYIVNKPVFKKGLIGTTSWKVKKLSLSGNYIERITLVNNDLDEKIVYRFFPSEERTILAFKLGEVTKILDINNMADFTNWKRINTDTKINTGEFVGVFFNLENDFLSEKTIRQALSYAIDKTDYDNGGNRAIGPISKNSWAYNSQVKTYKYDLEKAKAVIDQYKKDSKNDTVEINLMTYPVLLTTAEKIANDWQKAGIKVNIQSVNGEPKDFQAFLAIFDTPSDPDQYSLWHSTQKETNITNYQNPRIDKLLEDGRIEIDVNNRLKIYFDFQRFLNEDAPVAFLYYPKTYTISK